MSCTYFRAQAVAEDHRVKAYWSNVYDQMDARYQLWREHRLGKHLFLSNPVYYARWTQIYFANPRLFDLGESGRVLLLPFLIDPQTLFLHLQQRHRGPAQALMQQADALIDTPNKRTLRFLPIRLCGNRLMQAIASPAKRIGRYRREVRV